jgi:hypothetical protein
MRSQTDSSLIEMALVGYTVKRDNIVQRNGRHSTPVARACVGPGSKVSRQRQAQAQDWCRWPCQDCRSAAKEMGCVEEVV